MKNKQQNFERELPSGYRQALYVNAKDKKLGIILNLIAVAVLVAVMFGAVSLLRLGGRLTLSAFGLTLPTLLIAYFAFFAMCFGYIVLHELVHGFAYKVMTGEKLTYGISWSCAFCGVPSIYTYRRTAVISVVAPLALFTLLLVPTLVLLYFVSPLYYLLVAFVFGLHLGGCSGDILVLCLLAGKFRGQRVLMKDTGPEQFFYVPAEETDTEETDTEETDTEAVSAEESTAEATPADETSTEETEV